MIESAQKQDTDRRQASFDMHDVLDGKVIHEECLHTPDDMMDYLGMEESGNGIGKHFRCRCGKEVIEVYGFQEMREL